MNLNLHWFNRHKTGLTMGQRIADAVAAGVGSWSFVISQGVIFLVWISWNAFAKNGFDPPPFIGLNLFLSFEAAFTASFVMMSQGRQAERDRHQAEEDYRVNLEAEKRIEDLQERIAKIEIDKLDKIIDMLGDKNERKMGTESVQ